MDDPIVIATGNPHKVDEIRAIFADAASGGPALGVCSLTEAAGDGPVPPEPVEDGDTFEANATIKAVAYARALGRVCLADDSGLEVDALDGAPGVHSAYYAQDVYEAGADRPVRDGANNAKLLGALANLPTEQRTARFVCVMVVAGPDGRILATSRGAFEGHIGEPPAVPRGTNGFGYDPLFELPEGVTSAELEPAAKNRRSHRALAARAMAERLGSAAGG